MSSDAAIKQSLLDMSEHEPEEAILYTSYYNSLRGGRRPPEDLSQWITRSDQQSPTRTARLRFTEAVGFLPRLQLRRTIRQHLQAQSEQVQNEALREDEKENGDISDPPSSTQTPQVVRQKRATSIGHVLQAASIVQLPHKVSTILLSLSLPKIPRTKHIANVPNEKFSKYPILSTSLENSLKRAKNNRSNAQRREKPQLVHLQCNGSNPQLENCRSKARLLNDQLSRYLSDAKERCITNRRLNVGGSKIPAIKYSYRRRSNRSDHSMEEIHLSLEVRNGAVGKLPV